MEAMDIRKIKGQQIAATCRIVKIDKAGKFHRSHDMELICLTLNFYCPNQNNTCSDHETWGAICKHIYAVEITLKKETDMHDNTTLTQTKKITYSQDWSAYDQAKTKERLLFIELLNDLCKGLPSPEYKFGRPTLIHVRYGICFSP